MPNPIRILFEVPDVDRIDATAFPLVLARRHDWRSCVEVERACSAGATTVDVAQAPLAIFVAEGTRA